MPIAAPQLPDRYTDVEHIGFGGMGDIFRARDSRLGRTVAVKLLADRFCHDESLRRRFTREAVAAGSLSMEPHVVTIFDVGECDGRPFIVMEYLSGGTLDDYIHDGPVEPRRVVHWLRQAALALDAAHAHRVVHRDVKPANLLLDPDHGVHVGDFGIARVLDESQGGMTAPGSVLGTAGYISPEQARGELADAASDRYSLGVVAYQLLTGRRPFERESMTAEAAAHVREPVPPASSLHASLPPAVDRVFERALAKDPDQRYVSAAAFVDDLERALAPGATTVLRAVVDDVPTEDMTMPLPVVGSAFAAPFDEPERAGHGSNADRGVAARRYEPADRRARRLPLVLISIGVLAVAVAGLAFGRMLVHHGSSSGAQAPASSASGVHRAAATTARHAAKTSPSTTTTAATTAAPTTTSSTPDVATKSAAPPAQQDSAAAASTGGTPTTRAAIALNDRGYQLMLQGDPASAIPLLRRALPALAGVRPTEAYADYNLGNSLVLVGNCAEGVPYLDRSEQLQGHRSEIDAARRRCA